MNAGEKDANMALGVMVGILILSLILMLVS